MRRFAAPKLGAYTGLAGLGLLAALVLGRPELVALAAPFAAVVALGLAFARAPEVDVRASVDEERVIEHDTVELSVDLWTEHTVPQLELLARTPEGLSIEEGANPALLRLPGHEPETLRFTLHAERWGGYALGETLLRARDGLGLFRYESRVPGRSILRVYPREEQLRSLVRPRETKPYAGDELSRRRGEGIEFADIRPFAFGDPVRRVNWRATARSGRLLVNEQHPERNADLVLFLDAFTEIRKDGSGTLDLALRAAATFARHAVGHRDRVGLVSFGGVLRWLQPGSGVAQLYRIADALIDTEILLNYAWKDIDIVPARTLPPQALVVALTPLLDERSVGALLDLRARGFDLAVIETSPLPYVEPGRSEHEMLAYRIWRLRRDALRTRYRKAGVAVGEWHEGEPLAACIEEVRAFRRHAVAGRG